MKVVIGFGGLVIGGAVVYFAGVIPLLFFVAGMVWTAVIVFSAEHFD